MQYNTFVTTMKQGFVPATSVDVITRTQLTRATITSVTPKGVDGLEVRWTEAFGDKENYLVQCMAEGNAIGNMAVVKRGVRRATCVGLTPGSWYTVRITSRKLGWRDAFTPNLTSESTKTALAAAHSVTIILRTDTVLMVTWQHADGDKDRYTLQCKANHVVEVHVPANVATANCTGLVPATAHSVKVITSKRGWRSNTSLHVSDDSTRTTTSRVSNITTLVSADAIHVSWTHAQGYRDGYILKCWIQGERPIQTSVDKENEFGTCSPTTPGSIYTITVTTTRKNFVAVATEEISLKTKLDLATNVEVSEKTAWSITARWTQARGNKDGYIMVCSHNGIATATSLTQQNNATCTQLMADTPYNITIQTLKQGWENVDTVPVNDTTDKMVRAAPLIGVHMIVGSLLAGVLSLVIIVFSVLIFTKIKKLLAIERAKSTLRRARVESVRGASLGTRPSEQTSVLSKPASNNEDQRSATGSNVFTTQNSPMVSTVREKEKTTTAEHSKMNASDESSWRRRLIEKDSSFLTSKVTPRVSTDMPSTFAKHGEGLGGLSEPRMSRDLQQSPHDSIYNADSRSRYGLMRCNDPMRFRRTTLERIETSRLDAEDIHVSKEHGIPSFFGQSEAVDETQSTEYQCAKKSGGKSGKKRARHRKKTTSQSRAINSSLENESSGHREAEDDCKSDKCASGSGKKNAKKKRKSSKSCSSVAYSIASNESKSSKKTKKRKSETQILFGGLKLIEL